jgi:hypothetical protein
MGATKNLGGVFAERDDCRYLALRMARFIVCVVWCRSYGTTGMVTLSGGGVHRCAGYRLIGAAGSYSGVAIEGNRRIVAGRTPPGICMVPASSKHLPTTPAIPRVPTYLITLHACQCLPSEMGRNPPG